jgi:hypothetical protein
MSLSKKTVGKYQTIVAISDFFHQKPMYDTIYKAIGDELEGFPGIWLFVALMADVFNEFEDERKIRWDVDHEYIATVSRYVKNVQSALFRGVGGRELAIALPGTAGEDACRRGLKEILKRSLMK